MGERKAPAKESTSASPSKGSGRKPRPPKDSTEADMAYAIGFFLGCLTTAIAVRLARKNR